MSSIFPMRDLMCAEKETYRPLLNFDNLVKREEVEGYHSKSRNISGCHRMVLASRSPMVTFPSSRRYWPPVSRSERGVQGAKERERARAAGFPLPVRSRGYVFGIWGCVFDIWGYVFGIWCCWFGIWCYVFVVQGCQFPAALHVLSCG